MGQRFAPSIANIYLSLWEENLKNKIDNFPIHWFRYIDDIFTIWNADAKSLKEFLNKINNFDPNIKITFSFNNTNTTFLDLNIYKYDNKLRHKVHFKDTNSHSILHTSSNHPKHIFRGIVYSQIRRWASLCTTRPDFEDACSLVFPIWRQRGYTKTLLRKTKIEVLNHLNINISWEFLSKNCSNCCFNKYYHFCDTFTINKIMYSIIGNFSCFSNNIIYLIFCKSCNIYYVGQTTNFHNRLYKHIESIKNNCSFLVHKHFRHNCNLNNFRIFIIDSAKTINKLKVKESNYIKKFKTRHPLGLNMTENYASTPTLTLPFNKISHKICSNITKICSLNKINIKTVYRQEKSLKEALK